MNILVLEHEPKIAVALSKLLSSWNLDAAICVDVESARSTLFDRSIDVILIDLRPADTETLPWVGELRESERFANLPILIMAGKIDKQAVAEVSRLHVDAFLVKPFEPTDLRRKIAAAHRKRQESSRLRGLQELFEGRTTYMGDITSPHVVFGEASADVKAYQDPRLRETTEYLTSAWNAIQACNREEAALDAGCVLEDETTNVILQLRKGAAEHWVRAVFLSMRCHGNAIVTARLLKANRGKSLAIYIIEDQSGEVPSADREALKKLKIRVLRRDKATEKMPELMNLHLRGKVPSVARQEEETSPQAVKGRIVQDIDTMATLPALPEVYEKISAYSRDPASDMQDWIKVIKLDPLTCAMVLKHANSLSLGIKAEITDIDRAIVLMGKNTVAGIVASEAVRKSFTSVQEMGFNLSEFWIHNLAVGFASHILALPVQDTEALSQQGLDSETKDLLVELDLPSRLDLDANRDPCFVAGTMHDIGKGVMVNSYPGLFPMILGEMRRQNWQVPMIVVERELAGGLTHAVAGELLIRKWGMEGQLGNAVLSHHKPRADDALSILVAIADLVGQLLYPFPKEAKTPLREAVEEDRLADANDFLPEGLLSEGPLTLAELQSLLKALPANVRRLAEEARRSIA
ncbi:MAG: HDOD domain-containing protein [Gemmatimonadetes bacterium]|nr:HDOD domain-containing protein [Gemmatimonadota bacterium]MBT7864677.1 HDOD domain-containing protein [Gemmatimonadota bacterium]